MATTRGLDERERAAWQDWSAAHAAVDAHLRRVLQREAGLSGADFDVLARLAGAPPTGRRMFALGDDLGWEKSRLSHQLRRMAERGLVVREDCGTDGRGALVRLTRAGRDAYRRATPRHADAVRRALLEALSPAQADALAEIAAAVLGHRTAPDGDGATGRRPADRRAADPRAPSRLDGIGRADRR